MAIGSTAAILGGLLAGGSALAQHVAGNKARGQARHQMHLQMQEAQKAREEQQRMFDAKLAEDARIHAENMQHARSALEANRTQFAAQLAQAQQGFELQQKAMQQQQADADRQFAVNQATLERSINAGMDKPQSTFKRPDMGVAGTILTNPLGVKKEDVKKGTNLLGGM